MYSAKAFKKKIAAKSSDLAIQTGPQAEEAPLATQDEPAFPNNPPLVDTASPARTSPPAQEREDVIADQTAPQPEALGHK